MGQRHQFAAIARLTLPHTANRSARYYPLAVSHHQWSYGRLPLRAARRFLDLVKQKENAQVIRAELREYERSGGGNFPNVPCPFISFLLGIANRIGLEDPLGAYISEYSYRENIEDLDGPHCWDNNDGYTIFDVTNPSNPKYCFVLGSSPISAEAYVRHYYPVPTSEQLDTKEHVRNLESSVLATIKALDGEMLMTRQMLAETWHKDFPVDSSDQQAELATIPVAEDKTIPPLADLSVGPLVDQALATGDVESLEKIVWLPGKVQLVKSAIGRQEQLPNTGLSILAHVLQQEDSYHQGVLGLCDMPLSSEQTISLVKQLHNVNVIDLSNVESITADTVREMLSIKPHITRLNLYGTSVDDLAIRKLVVQMPHLFYHMEALLHPTFFDHAILPCTPAFSFIGTSKQWKTRLGASLPYFTPSRIVQCLTDYLRPYVAQKDYRSWEAMETSVLPLAVFSTGTRRSEQRWGERSVSIYPEFSAEALSGRGWVFALQCPARTRPYLFSTAKYGFLAANPDAVQNVANAKDQHTHHTQLEWRVYDIRSFLQMLNSEGRPMPDEDAVKVLEDILESLAKPNYLEDYSGVALELMDEGDVVSFIQSVRSSRDRS